MSEKRRFIRRQSIQLFDYLVLGDEGATTNHSMGRTIDMSKAGLKLETTEPFASGSQLKMTVALNEDLVELKGTGVHCHQTMGRYLSGIALEKLHDEPKRVYQKYIDSF